MVSYYRKSHFQDEMHKLHILDIHTSWFGLIIKLQLDYTITNYQIIKH